MTTWEFFLDESLYYAEVKIAGLNPIKDPINNEIIGS